MDCPKSLVTNAIRKHAHLLRKLTVVTFSAVFLSSIASRANAAVNLNVNVDVLGVANAIASSVNATANRGAFTDNLATTVFYKLGQKYNVLVVNMAQHPQTGNLRGVVFYGSATYSFDGTIFGVWAFKSGAFTHDGDGGWINWAMIGWYDRNGHGGKHVVFRAP